MGYYNESTPEFRFSLSGGLPWGSVLGLTLFNIAMAAMHEVELGHGQDLVSIRMT